MMSALLRVDHNDERPFRRNGDEIRMRHAVALAAGGVDLVGNKGHRAIEVADRLDDHEATILPWQVQNNVVLIGHSQADAQRPPPAQGSSLRRSAAQVDADKRENRYLRAAPALQW